MSGNPRQKEPSGGIDTLESTSQLNLLASYDCFNDDVATMSRFGREAVRFLHAASSNVGSCSVKFVCVT